MCPKAKETNTVTIQLDAIEHDTLLACVGLAMDMGMDESSLLAALYEKLKSLEKEWVF